MEYFDQILHACMFLCFLIVSSHPGMQKGGEDLPNIILTDQDLLVKMLITLEPRGILIKFGST